MRRTAVAICGSLLVCGCSGLDPSKLVPSAAAGFQKAVTGVTTTETNLISAFQQENQSLLFLSANTYSCGDPNEPTVRRYLGAKDPASLVSNEHINKYWTQSLKYLGSYVKLLNVIVGNAQSSVSDIDATVSAGTFAASIIPGIQSPAAGAALKALGVVAKDAANLVAEGYLVGAAQAAARPLAVAVGYLQKYYPAFEGNELLAFNAWDECAHEKLAFIRDNPFGRVPGYPTPFFCSKRWRRTRCGVRCVEDAAPSLYKRRHHPECRGNAKADFNSKFQPGEPRDRTQSPISTNVGSDDHVRIQRFGCRPEGDGRSDSDEKA
jgi:hypothetical protein